MNRLKRVAALCSKTGDRIKDGWLCGAEILSSRTSGSWTKRAFHSEAKKPGDERNKKRREAASDGVYSDETGRLI